MSKTQSIAIESANQAESATWKDWLMLTKPEITFLVTISALAGFVLGSTGPIDGWLLFWALLGIPMTSAGGCALNHYLERTIDASMKRTANRPIPGGRISAEKAKWFGFLLVGGGLGILCPLTNPLTGVLAGLTVVLYLFVYTPLKRKTSWNTLVGTIPGALPVLGGWTAASGSLGLGGWVLFGVLVCWQMPHFFSLAWMYRLDYEKGGFRMLTVEDENGDRTARQMTGYSIGMIAFSAAPVVLGLSSKIYLVGALALGVWFMVPVLRFQLTRSVYHARRVLKASVLYVPLLLLAIVADRLIG